MQPLVSWSLYDRLQAGQPAVGAWIALTDPASAEIVSADEWDFLIIEAEHICYNPETIRAILMAITTHDKPAIVRVPWRTEYHIKYALDTGAAGVLVPRIETAEQAAEAISYTRYPPKGRRGFAPQRVSNYARALKEYAQNAHKVLCLLMIETASAVEHIDEICALDGLGGLLIGPSDLAVDLGLMDHMGEDHPRLREAMDHVYERARAAGVPYGAVAGPPERVIAELQRGAKIVTAGSDLAWLRGASRETARRIREGLAALQA
jgi:2-keto-3-deoxy-L-rhamnonate aldolase RhmA